MKNRIAGIVLFMFFGLWQGMAEESVWWGSYYTPFRPIIGSGLGFGGGSGAGLNIAANVSLELPLHKLNIAESLPLDLSAAARVRYALDIDADLQQFAGAGLGLGAHLGFRGFDALDIPFGAAITPLDLYINAGLGYDFFIRPATDELGLGVMLSSGIGYFLNEHLQVYLRNDTWRGNSELTVGVAWRFGEKPQLASGGKTGPVWQISSLEARTHLNQLLVMDREIFSFADYFLKDPKLNVGEGLVWEIDIRDADDTVKTRYRLEQCLLAAYPDGSTLRRTVIIYLESGMREVYEYRVDRNDRLLLMRITKGEDDRILEYLPKTAVEWRTSPGTLRFDAVGYPLDNLPVVEARECGPYACHRLQYPAEEGEAHIEVFLSPDAPGAVAGFIRHEKQETIAAGLIEVLSECTGELIDSLK